MTDEPKLAPPPAAEPKPLFRAAPIAEPEIYVPRWQDGTPKAETFWNDIERRIVAMSHERIVEHREAPARMTAVPPPPEAPDDAA